MFDKLIKVLLDIKIWSIIGVLVSIATVAITWQQRRDVKIVCSLHSKEDLELVENQSLDFVFVSVGCLPDDVQTIVAPCPIGFYNPNKDAVDIECSMLVEGIGCSLPLGRPCAMKILREYGANLDVDFVYDVKPLREIGMSKSQVKLFWSYEKMSEDNDITLKITSMTVGGYRNHINKDAKVVLYALDSIDYNSKKAVYKILNGEGLTNFTFNHQNE